MSLTTSRINGPELHSDGSLFQTPRRLRPSLIICSATPFYFLSTTNRSSSGVCPGAGQPVTPLLPPVLLHYVVVSLPEALGYLTFELKTASVRFIDHVGADNYFIIVFSLFHALTLTHTHATLIHLSHPHPSPLGADARSALILHVRGSQGQSIVVPTPTSRRPPTLHPPLAKTADAALVINVFIWLHEAAAAAAEWSPSRTAEGRLPRDTCDAAEGVQTLMIKAFFFFPPTW